MGSPLAGVMVYPGRARQIGLFAQVNRGLVATQDSTTGVGGHDPVPAIVPEALRREFEELGLSSYEARVLLALLQLGSAGTLHLARLSGVPRTSTYQVLEELSVKRVAERVPGDGPAVWACPGHEEVLDQLDALEEERLRSHRSRTTRLRQTLADAFPERVAVGLPYVHIIHSIERTRATYERLLGEAKAEILVVNRPPYSWASGQVNSAVLRALDRKVSTRVLYQAEQWEHPDAEPFRREMAVYHDAGAEGRVVDELPIKLAVIDRKVALTAMTDPVVTEAAYPTSLLIEHPGFAAVQADAFDHRWQEARPL